MIRQATEDEGAQGSHRQCQGNGNRYGGYANVEFGRDVFDDKNKQKEIQCIERPRATCSLPTIGMLFSAWQATMHPLQPMQLFKSIDMPHA